MTKIKHAFDVEVFVSAKGEGKSKSEYANDQIVFSQGDEADSVFFLVEGRVKVSVVSQQGKEAIVAVLTKGDFFGEGCLTGQVRRLATVRTMEASTIHKLGKSTIVRMLRDEPDFCARFLLHVLRRNARVEADLVDHLFNSSEKRLARLLLLMARFGQEGTQQIVIPKFSQETLAEMVGTTRSRINVFMRKFHDLGFIDYDGGVRVMSSLLSVILND